jgi:hypothetical protein
MKVNKFCGLPPSGLSPMKIFLFLSIFLSVVGCTTSKTVSTNTQNTNFNDDLSKFRVKFSETSLPNVAEEIPTNKQQSTPQAAPTSSVNTDLDTLIARIANSNRSFTIKGYRIQVYSGLQRKDAEIVKMDLKKILPDGTADLEYSQPNYKVKTGNFLNRIDTYQTYYKIREVYPGASIVFEKIKVPRY